MGELEDFFVASGFLRPSFLGFENLSHEGGLAKSPSCLISSFFFVIVFLLVGPSFAWGQNHEVVEGEFIVRFKKTSKPSVVRGFSQKGLSLGFYAKGKMRSSKVGHFKVEEGVDLDQMMEELRLDPEVEYVEPNYKIKAFSDESLQPIGAFGQYSQSGTPVQLNEAWAAMTNTVSYKPIVAVIDTGILKDHTFFSQSGAIWSNAGEIAGNSIDDDQNGFVDDVYGWNFLANNSLPLDDDGHGTHVAGIVLGTTMDVFANSLPAAKIRIMPLKFLGADGSGDTVGAVNAIDYAVENGADVINASWGGGGYSKSLHEALARAYEAGVLVVTAAGNSGMSNDSSPIYPANLTVPSLVSVGAVNDFDLIASFSNYGIYSVHLGAPGVNVISAAQGPGLDSVIDMDGTSMAAPFVAGIGALLLREAPVASGYQLKQMLISSVDVKDSLTNRFSTKGRINALKAIQTAQAHSGDATYNPSYTVIVPVRSLASSSESRSSGGGGCGSLALIGQGGHHHGDGHGDGNGGATGAHSMGPVILLLLMPLLIAILLRYRESRLPLSISNRSAFLKVYGERLSLRYDFADEVMLRRQDGSLVNLKARNISQTGLAVKAAHLSPTRDLGWSDARGRIMGEHGLVTLIFTDKKSLKSVEIQARLVWSDEQRGMGFQFESLTQWALTFLKQFQTGVI